MENQGIAQEQAVENPSVQFLSDEEVQAAQAPQETQPVIEQLQEEVAPQQESTEPAETIENTETTQTPDEEEVDVEGTVLSYLSERLGREMSKRQAATLKIGLGTSSWMLPKWMILPLSNFR
jgi:hypothetical protein